MRRVITFLWKALMFVTAVISMATAFMIEFGYVEPLDPKRLSVYALIAFSLCYFQLFYEKD